MSPDGNGVVRLTVPPDAANLRLVRLLVAATVTNENDDVDVDVIDDVRVASDELTAALLAAAPGAEAPVTVEVRIGDGSLAVTGSRDLDAPVPELDPIAAALLEVTLDEYRLESSGTTVTFSLLKRLDSDEA